MKYQIARISLFQTAKVIAVLYLVFGIIGLAVMVIRSMVQPEAGGFALSFLLVPFIYALVGFVLVMVFGWIYNQVAKRVGGIEVTLAETRGDF